MGIMVSKKAVEVELEYYEVGDFDLVVMSNDRQKELFKGKTKKVLAKFQRPRYGTFNDYIAGCFHDNPETGFSELDSVKFKKNKLQALLTELTDEKGEKIVIDRDFFTNVHPDFAIGLIDAFDEKVQKEKMDFLQKEGILEKINPVEEKKDEKVVENAAKE